MSVLRSELARSTKGPVSSNEDWWYLCRDTDTGDVFVIHEWVHTDVAKSGNSDVGSTHIELSAFLAETRQTAAQRELRKLIGSLVDETADAARP